MVDVFENLGYYDIPLDVWLNAARKRMVVPGLFDERLDAFKLHMRSLFIHSPWNHRGKLERVVYLERGQRVPLHQHDDEWTLIYYAYFGGEQQGSLLVEGVEVNPKLDSAILVPPGVKHEVPAVVDIDLRYSVAFRVHTHDDWTLA